MLWDDLIISLIALLCLFCCLFALNDAFKVVFVDVVILFVFCLFICDVDYLDVLLLVLCVGFLIDLFAFVLFGCCLLELLFIYYDVWVVYCLLCGNSVVYFDCFI